MLKISLYLLFLIPSLCQAQIYGLLQGGYSQLNQDSASKNKVYPSGNAFAAGLGVRKDFYELEFSLQKFSGEAALVHDDQKNTFKHEQASLLFALNFYFSKRFYGRFGYGFHKVDQELGKKVSPASERGAEKAYGLKKDVLTDGILFGAGFVIFDGDTVSIYTQVQNQMMSSLGASAWNGVLGVKIYTK